MSQQSVYQSVTKVSLLTNSLRWPPSQGQTVKEKQALGMSQTPTVLLGKISSKFNHF